MQRSPETYENRSYEMISIDDAQTSGLKGACAEMQCSANDNGKTKDAEKTAEFCTEMQLQKDLFRRLMCLMAVFLLIVFLTAAASLVLAVATVIGKTPNQVNSSQGSNSTRCGESLSLPELKLKITELERALNFIGSHVKELTTELKMQKAVVTNLTTQGSRCSQCTGLPGPPGPQGPIGPRGVQGAQGPKGPRGFNGTKGPLGPIGPRGFKGSQGSQGSPGIQGPMGPRGVNGSQGPSGLPGVTGPMGPPGKAPHGSSGAWNVSRCQYKYKKEAAKTFGVSATSRVTLREDDHKGTRIVGATCSTEMGAEYNFQGGKIDPKTNTIVYNCICKGASSLFVGPKNMACVIHYWVCPFTS